MDLSIKFNALVVVVFDFFVIQCWKECSGTALLSCSTKIFELGGGAESRLTVTWAFANYNPVTPFCGPLKCSQQCS